MKTRREQVEEFRLREELVMRIVSSPFTEEEGHTRLDWFEDMTWNDVVDIKAAWAEAGRPSIAWLYEVEARILVMDDF